MMRPPLLAVVHILPNKMSRRIRLWVPLFLIWLLLLPFLLVLLPVYFVVCAAIDIHPFATLDTGKNLPRNLPEQDRDAGDLPVIRS